jgi:squalene synthase HpnC
MLTIREDISIQVALHPSDRPGAGAVRKDLDRFGPGSKFPAMGLDEAFAYCQQLANAHYENFSVATRLAPRSIRPHLCSIYAYCRWSDDLADEMEDPGKSLQLLEWWRAELDACFEGRSRHPVMRAVQQTVAEFSIPKAPFTDLLSAFLQDQSVHEYESQAQLLDYCHRSADPVGRMVLCLANASDPATIRWSDSICTGLQLANFCQDILVDARRGRRYLPRDQMEPFGMNDSMLRNGQNHVEARHALACWVQDARERLMQGLPLVQQVPRWLARSLQLFARGGLALLDNIELAGFDVWSHPITVSRSQKRWLIARALLFPRDCSGLQWDSAKTLRTPVRARESDRPRLSQ